MRTSHHLLVFLSLLAVACSETPRIEAILAFPAGAQGWDRIADAATARGLVTVAPLPASARDAVVEELADLPTFLWPPAAGTPPADSILLDDDLALPTSLPAALGSALAERLLAMDLPADAAVEVLTTDRAAEDTVALLRALVEGLGEPEPIRLAAVHEADDPDSVRSALDPDRRERPLPDALVVLDAPLLAGVASSAAASPALLLAPRTLRAPDATPAEAWTIEFPIDDYVDRLTEALQGRRDRSRAPIAPRWLAPLD